ncbi:MAG: ATP-binding protein [Thermodesulfobacteriota bacterium]
MAAEDKGREPAGSVDIQRTLPATAEDVDAMLREIMDALEKNRFPVGDYDEIRLALREALNNAVKHGSGFNAGKKVHVAVRCNLDDGFWISIRDEGAGFDPDQVPNPTEPENLERFSGRGLFMIRELMDDVQFHDRGREIRMLRRPRPD